MPSKMAFFLQTMMERACDWPHGDGGRTVISLRGAARIGPPAPRALRRSLPGEFRGRPHLSVIATISLIPLVQIFYNHENHFPALQIRMSGHSLSLNPEPYNPITL